MERIKGPDKIKEQHVLSSIYAIVQLNQIRERVDQLDNITTLAKELKELNDDQSSTREVSNVILFESLRLNKALKEFKMITLEEII